MVKVPGLSNVFLISLPSLFSGSLILLVFCPHCYSSPRAPTSMLPISGLPVGANLFLIIYLGSLSLLRPTENFLCLLGQALSKRLPTSVLLHPLGHTSFFYAIAPNLGSGSESLSEMFKRY